MNKYIIPDLIPRKEWDTTRLTDISTHISKLSSERKEISYDLISEYNSLISQLSIQAPKNG